MPVLIYGSGGGGSGAGYRYAPGNIINPVSALSGDKVQLNWQDPDDIVVSGKPINGWKGTVVVCKQGSRPRGINDGAVVCESTVKNQFKDAPLTTNIGGAGYCYGIFPYTEEYVVNVSEGNIVAPASVLGDVPWDSIAGFSKQGLAGKLWKVGDEKKITLSSPYNREIIVQVAGFGHDGLSDGSGTAGITFISKEVFVDSPAHEKGMQVLWPDTTLRKNIKAVKSSLPAELQRVIKTVSKPYCSPADFNIHFVEDDIFVPSVCELGLYESGYGRLGEGTQYAIFSDEENRIKKYNNTPAEWWTRSIMTYSASTLARCYIMPNGTTNYSSNLSTSYKNCIMFCV